MSDVGKLVTPRKIKNHTGNCYRLYSLTNLILRGSEFKYPTLVDKLFYDEIGLILSLDEESFKFLVLSPRGISGWCSCENLILL